MFANPSYFDKTTYSQNSIATTQRSVWEVSLYVQNVMRRAWWILSGTILIFLPKLFRRPKLTVGVKLLPGISASFLAHVPHCSAYNEQLGRSRVQSVYSKINFPLKMFKSFKFADFEPKDIPQKKRFFLKSRKIWKSTSVAVISLEHHHRNWDLSMVHPTYDAFEGSWLTVVFLNFKMV